MLCNLLHFPFTATNCPNMFGSWWLVYLVRDCGMQHINILINAQQQHRQDPTLMAALGTEAAKRTEHCWGWPGQGWASPAAESRRVGSSAQCAGHPSPTMSNNSTDQTLVKEGAAAASLVSLWLQQKGYADVSLLSVHLCGTNKGEKKPVTLLPVPMAGL